MVSQKDKVTKVEVQKKNKDRVNIYIDNDYSFSCSSELVYKYGIKAGGQIEIEVVRAVAEDDNYLKCKSAALRVIEKGYKSEKEIHDKLIEKGYEDKIVMRVIEFLKSYSFLNDAQFAEMYIRDKIKVQGRNKIKFSLLKKGIQEEVVLEKLSAIDADMELSTAMSIADKRLRLLKKNESDKRTIYKKLWDFLLRNGYDKSIAEDVLAKVSMDELEEAPKIEREVDLDALYSLAKKRFEILSRSEGDNRKLYKKLGDYLLRKGYPWEEVKKTLKQLLNNEEIDE